MHVSVSPSSFDLPVELLALAVPLLVDKTRAAGDLCRRYIREVPLLGMGASSKVFLAEASARRPLSKLVHSFAPALVTIKPAGYQFPLTFRRIGSDIAVVRQMLIREEYQPIAGLPGVNLIVDCGANIGASAYYLLHRYPSAHLIAIEPDVENVGLCRRNLAPFGARVTVIRAAVWSECKPLRIVPESRARGAWALRVEPAAAGAAEVDGLPMPQILERAGIAGPIDVLKIDIEGAETEMFSGQCRDWLDATRHIAIELHGPASQAAFDQALTSYVCQRDRSHELTVVRNLRRADSPSSAVNV